MPPTVDARLDAVERKPLKCALRGTSETFVRGGQIFETAREHCGLSKEQTAEHYGVSHSLMTRQASNQDNQHLSFQRICEMPPAFRREVALLMLAEIDGIELETTVRIKRTA